jgi:hypothetical protein
LNAKFFRNGIVMLVLVIGTVALLYTWLIQTPNTTPVGYSAFLSDVGANKVQNVVQEDQTLTVKTTDNRTYTVVVPTVLAGPSPDRVAAGDPDRRIHLLHDETGAGHQ